jgi:signal transduction histidine kinase
MKMQSKLLILTFRDMIDFQALKVNKFRKLNIKFNLKECLDEVIQMMKFRAQASKVKLNFTFEFQNESDAHHNMVTLIEHQRLAENLLRANSHIDDHPLFKLV